MKNVFFFLGFLFITSLGFSQEKKNQTNTSITSNNTSTNIINIHKSPKNGVEMTPDRPCNYRPVEPRPEAPLPQQPILAYNDKVKYNSFSEIELALLPKKTKR